MEPLKTVQFAHNTRFCAIAYQVFHANRTRNMQRKFRNKQRKKNYSACYGNNSRRKIPKPWQRTGRLQVSKNIENRNFFSRFPSDRIGRDSRALRSVKKNLAHFLQQSVLLFFTTATEKKLPITFSNNIFFITFAGRKSMALPLRALIVKWI